MATFVLVQALGPADGSGRKIIRLLRAAGHKVLATTATGMGDRVHLPSPAINLDTYIIDVVNVIEFEDARRRTQLGRPGSLVVEPYAKLYLSQTTPSPSRSRYQSYSGSLPE